MLSLMCLTKYSRINYKYRFNSRHAKGFERNARGSY
ncbi:hypothetical protein DR79_1745 [Francisella tularensis]|nr:hypothetical protein DR79_1745 [Francisella tularensis]